MRIAYRMESGGTPFPEVLGFLVHGINGMFVMPALALVLFGVALYAGLRIGNAASTRQPAPLERVSAPV